MRVLEKLCQAWEEGDVDSMMTCIRKPPRISERMMRELLSSGEQMELTRSALAKLVKSGKWGPMAEVHGERGKRLIRSRRLEPSRCWSLVLPPAHAGFYQTENGFVVLDCEAIDDPHALPSK